jgi:hypothetical protein
MAEWSISTIFQDLSATRICVNDTACGLRVSLGNQHCFGERRRHALGSRTASGCVDVLADCPASQYQARWRGRALELKSFGYD